MCDCHFRMVKNYTHSAARRFYLASEASNISDDPPAGVYVITPKCGYPSKIGVTGTPSIRLAMLQVGNWHPLEMRDFVFAADFTRRVSRWDRVCNFVSNAAFQLEMDTHKALAEMDMHLNGEWFDVTAEEASAVIRKVAEKAGDKVFGLPELFSLDEQTLPNPVQQFALRRLIAVAKDAERIISGRKRRVSKQYARARIAAA